MSDIERIKLFENKKVRTAWDEEKRLGRSVVSREKAIDHIKSPEELPSPDEQKQG
ncbi:MAG: hypothetical protein K6F25_00865 [Bacteroidales bacterium]|nr:hypothetical protein [Bacteroidales bacterium]